MTVEKVEQLPKERLRSLANRTIQIEQEKKKLLGNWYELLFDLVEGIPSEQLGTPVYFREVIDPYWQNLNLGGDFWYPIDWLATQFHSESDVSILYQKGQQDIKTATITFKSRRTGMFRSSVCLEARTETEPNYSRTIYSMLVQKVNQFVVDNTVEEHTEYQDPTKVSELDLVQIACIIAGAYSQPLQRTSGDHIR